MKSLWKRVELQGLRQGAAVWVLLLAVLLAGCSRKQEPEAEQEEMTVSEESGDTVDEDSQWYPRGERIEGQCFDTILDPVGRVAFISCWPEDTAKEGDAVFLIEKNGVIWQQLEGMTENNIREGLKLNQVEAVSFADSNRDGYGDILIICSYVNRKNEKNCEVRYYQGSETGSFAMERTLSAELTDELEAYTIAAAKDYLKAKFGFSDEPQESVVRSATDSEWQLQLLAENYQLWRGDEEYVSYGYAVTDLDRNGRLEILAASMQGTGLYTYAVCFEVNETGTGVDEVLMNLDELEYLESGPDIMVKTVPAYCDSSKGIYRYLFEDFLRISAVECVSTQMILVKEGNELVVEPLAYDEIASGEDSETHIYRNMDGEELAQDAYNSLADERFSDLDKRSARIGWLYPEAGLFDLYSTAELAMELAESWSSFDIY